MGETVTSTGPGCALPSWATCSSPSGRGAELGAELMFPAFQPCCSEVNLSLCQVNHPLSPLVKAFVQLIPPVPI